MCSYSYAKWHIQKVLKPWYARSTKDGDQSLSDIFNDFASGEFDGSNVAIGEKYQTVQVRYFIIYYKKTLSSFRVKYVYISTCEIFISSYYLLSLTDKGKHCVMWTLRPLLLSSQRSNGTSGPKTHAVSLGL